MSLDTTRYAWSHLQHLLNIPTLHQLQASEICRKLELNPKEVGHAYLFSPLSLLLLFSRSQFSSVHVISVTVTFHVLLLSLSCFLFFPLCYPLPLTFLPCPLQAHFSLSPKTNMDNLRMRWEPLCIHSISLTVPLPCPYSLVFLSSLGPEATRPTLDQWPKNYAWRDSPKNGIASFHNPFSSFIIPSPLFFLCHPLPLLVSLALRLHISH